ncbi:MAG: TIGR04013 family B12-binding domain/radical SAM domain-containing protein [Candidatus Heimdallarchaeota archaeon]
MPKDCALVVYYYKNNIYSFNALIAALETDNYFDDFKIYFIKKKEELIDGLKNIIEKHELIIVGFSFFTTQLWEIYDLISILKKKCKHNVVYIAGGPHATGDPLGVLKLGFDFVVVGEGEKTFIELLKKLKIDSDYENVKGISYINGSNDYVFTGKRDLINLDDYPPFPLRNRRFGAIEITRGCPYLCYFCQTPYISGTKPRHRSIESICKYVQVLHNYYGDLTDIRFITPNAFSYGSLDGKVLNLTKLETLLKRVREIIGKKGHLFLGTFPSEVRPEDVTSKTLSLILQYADNDNITIGAQSGSQRILDLCHRDHTIKDIYSAVELSLNYNLKINVDFIFGLPGENEEDVKLTISMMRELSNKSAKVHAHSFIPLPQTPFAKVPVKKIKDLYKKEINKLISKGSAFGDWKKQEKLALRIARYMKTMKLE